MKASIILFIACLSFACVPGKSTGSNSTARSKVEYTPPAEYKPGTEYNAERAKHEKWKQEREAYLKKVNDLEKKRLESIKKCEADRLKKPQPQNANTEPEQEVDPRPCEEQFPPN